MSVLLHGGALFFVNCNRIFYFCDGFEDFVNAGENEGISVSPTKPFST